jgi:glycosyltransferase involved in cell wall biosynthesis
MKILILNASDLIGGAARAAYRLHRGLVEMGLDSRMLVQSKYSNDPAVETIYSCSKAGKLYTRFRPMANRILQKFQKTTSTVPHSANFLPSGLYKKINNSRADLIHMHWIGAEMISINEIAKITKPIVWTLHDMWAFCGSEHYDDLKSPERYEAGYYRTNRPRDYSGIDIDRWTWNRKKKYWKNKTFNVITPSRWLADCASKSALFQDQGIYTIPNGLDLNIYKPVDKKFSRKKLNIPDQDNIKYILFGAMSATNDERKGYKELSNALHYLVRNYNKEHFRLIVFGSEAHNGPDFGMPVSYLGKLNNDETLALAYSASDVMVVPSLQDNLPNTAVEAIACGIPIAAFNIGGLPDIVDHKKNGYLANPYDSEDLADGIKWILDDAEKYTQLKAAARNKARSEFDIKNVVQQYNSLYKTILVNKSTDPLVQ